MRVIVALCVIFALAQAAHQTYWYAGSVNTTGTPFANAVDTSVTTGCATLGYQTGYRNFTVNVTTTGFFYFTALFERNFKADCQIQVYSGAYNPANSCANLVFAVNGAVGVPHIEFLQYFTPGLYQVVITSDNNITQGLFAIHVDVATLNGGTNELTSNWWTSPTGQNDGSRNICEDSVSNAPYTSFSFYQNGTTVSDVLVFSYNSTTNTTYDFSAALYNSANLNFLGNGNQTNPVSGCNTTNFVYGWGSSDTDLDFNIRSGFRYLAAGALGLTLTNGTTYTIVAGSYQSPNVLSSRFGVFIRPTILGYTTNQTFTDPPVISSSDCTPSSRDPYYGFNTFTAQYPAYILDNSQPGSYFDAAGCLYYGINTGSATTSPINCPGNTTTSVAFIQCGDTGDISPIAFFLTPGYNYTWIQLPLSGNGNAGAPYLLYNYSGKPLGSVPITTSAAATTGSATTAAAEASSSSSASAVVAMLSLVIAAMFF